MSNISCIDLPVQGDLGNTKITCTERCANCNQLEQHYSDWAISFDSWNGEDWVTLTKHSFVSERLKEQLEAVGVKGVQFELVQVLKGDYFYIGEAAYQPTFPAFYRLITQELLVETIPGRTFERVCEACHRRTWSMDSISDWISYSLSGADKDPLQVPAKQWKEQDIFMVEMLSVPFITPKVKAIVENLKQRDTSIYEAAWV